MKFREGTVGDKNNGYIYSDFTLTGQTGGQVEVYVKSYKVEVTNKYTKKTEVYDGATHITVDGNKKPSTYLAYQNPCPIRIAFIRNSAEASTVIDPTAIIASYADECQLIRSARQQPLKQRAGHFPTTISVQVLLFLLLTVLNPKT